MTPLRPPRSWSSSSCQADDVRGMLIDAPRATNHVQIVIRPIVPIPKRRTSLARLANSSITRPAVNSLPERVWDGHSQWDRLSSACPDDCLRLHLRTSLTPSIKSPSLFTTLVQRGKRLQAARPHEYYFAICDPIWAEQSRCGGAAAALFLGFADAAPLAGAPGAARLWVARVAILAAARAAAARALGAGAGGSVEVVHGKLRRLRGEPAWFVWRIVQSDSGAGLNETADLWRARGARP